MSTLWRIFADISAIIVIAEILIGLLFAFVCIGARWEKEADDEAWAELEELYRERANEPTKG